MCNNRKEVEEGTLRTVNILEKHNCEKKREGKS